MADKGKLYLYHQIDSHPDGGGSAEDILEDYNRNSESYSLEDVTYLFEHNIISAEQYRIWKRQHSKKASR